MKTLKIKISKDNKKNIKTGIKTAYLASEYFKCSRCGYTVRIRALGNTARCSQCGGTMHRC